MEDVFLIDLLLLSIWPHKGAIISDYTSYFPNLYQVEFYIWLYDLINFHIKELGIALNTDTNGYMRWNDHYLTRIQNFLFQSLSRELKDG